MAVLLIVLLITSCFSVPLPNTFPKCNRKQVDFNDCFTKAVKEVVYQLTEAHPEVDLPSFHPLITPQVTVAAGTSAVHFVQKFKNVKVDKLSEFSSLKASMDFVKHVLEIEIDYPELDFSFEYDINGKILIMPIRGKGPGSMFVENALAKLTFKLEENNNHYKVVNASMTYEKVGGFHVNFENLFDGDKALSANINNVINENWKDIFNDVKGSYETVFAKVLQGILNRFFARVAVTELFGEA